MEIYHPQDEDLLREMRRVRRVARRKRLLWGFLIFLILTAIAGWFVYNRYYTLVVFHGSAMADTLPDGSLVLVRKDAEYGRGDLVLYEREDGTQIKRVLAMPGDRVVLNPYGLTRVNGEELKEMYAEGRQDDARGGARRLTLESGEVFVQGDQLSLSSDSRNRSWGNIQTSQISGKAEFVLWPVSHFGVITGGAERIVVQQNGTEAGGAE